MLYILTIYFRENEEPRIKRKYIRKKNVDQSQLSERSSSLNSDSSPEKGKRRGRGKGKKTLAMEAALAVEAAEAASEQSGLEQSCHSDTNTK